MKVEWSPDDLRPIVEAAVDAVLLRREAEEKGIGGQLAYDAGQSAQLLGLNGSHNIDDLRRRGKLRGVLAGKRYVYPREELLRFLRDS
jgi:hypothetical protein